MPGLAAGVFHDTISRQGLPAGGSPKPLAEVMREHGYDCGLWSDNYLFGSEYNYDRGFVTGDLGKLSWKKRIANAARRSSIDRAFDMLEWVYFNVFQRVADAGAQEGTFYESADQLHREALGWLDGTNDASQLCWIHYMDTHHPYQPPTEYLRERSFNSYRNRSELGHFTRQVIKANGVGYSSEEIEDVVTAYEAAVAYLTDRITDFVDALLAEGHFDPAEDVLVLTADHGECLYPAQHGMMGHHPHAFWEEITHVPLVVSRPDWSAGTVTEQVSLVDVMPTVLDAVGLPIPEGIDGRPASWPEEMVRHRAFSVSLKFIDENTSRTYRSVRSATGWKLFGAERPGGDEIVLTRRRDDPEVREEIVHATGAGGPGPTDEHAEAWNELIDALGARGPPIEASEMRVADSTQLEDHLRDLGYVQ